MIREEVSVGLGFCVVSFCSLMRDPRDTERGDTKKLPNEAPAIRNEGEECYNQCDQIPGAGCAFCGALGACCRAGGKDAGGRPRGCGAMENGGAHKVFRSRRCSCRSVVCCRVRIYNTSS